jgi:hypothetical protein
MGPAASTVSLLSAINKALASWPFAWSVSLTSGRAPTVDGNSETDDHDDGCGTMEVGKSSDATMQSRWVVAVRSVADTAAVARVALTGHLLWKRSLAWQHWRRHWTLVSRQAVGPVPIERYGAEADLGSRLLDQGWSGPRARHVLRRWRQNKAKQRQPAPYPRLCVTGTEGTD